MFKVECVGCQAPYQVDERRVPEKGLKMRCPKCGTTFKVEAPSSGAGTSAPAAPEPQPTMAPQPQPFSSAAFDAAKLGKAPGARDSLSRTMIGVSSAEIESGAPDSTGEASKKPFRIPRPASVAAAPAVAQPPVSGHDVGLPAVPATTRSLGLTTRGTGDVEVALPAVVNKDRRPAVAPAANEVHVVLPSAVPAMDESWLGAEEPSEAPPAEEPAAFRLSALPQPVAARPAPGESSEPPAAAPSGAPLELDVGQDLPIVAAPARRPPPRRPRAQPEPSPSEGADLPARPSAELTGLPAVPAPPRPLDRAPRPPARQKPSSLDGLDLPAIPPRVSIGSSLAPGRGVSAPPPPRARSAAPTLADLPAARARSEHAGLTDADLPAFGSGAPGAAQDLPEVFGGSGGASASDLPSVFGGAARSEDANDLPGVFGGEVDLARGPASDLPSVFGGASAPPSALGLPEVRAPGLDAAAVRRAAAPTRADLPAVAPAGLPDVLSVDLPDVHDTGLPDVFGAGLPEVSAGLPDIAAGLPEVSSALPEVSAAGLPDISSAGLPARSDVALPEVLAPGVASFGRVDLPVPRPAELPEVKSQRLGFDAVDLPGVGESLPSVASGWGEANLPVVGSALPMAKGANGSFDAAETPFGAFEPAADGDPFASPDPRFGAADPFGAPDPAFEDGLAPPTGDMEADLANRGYGEVDIGSPSSTATPLETAEDGAEFQAIPEGESVPAGRAAASASVHVDADGEAAGSTLELGPERKAPRERRRRMVAIAALSLATIAGGALALVPAVGPFGVHFVLDQIKRGEHERLTAKLVADTREAERRDTFEGLRAPLRELESARDLAPRFQPLALQSAIHHYKAVLRFGPLPELETAAKVALDPIDAEDESPLARLARAARAAAGRSADAKALLGALGSDPDARELLGELSLRTEDWPAASNVWSALAKADPQSARAAFGVARAALGMGKLAEAKTQAERVLTLEPTHVGAPILLLEAERASLRESSAAGTAADSTERLAAAVARLLPRASPAEAALGHVVLGELHASQGRAQPAQQAFEAALVIDRAMPRALVGLGEVLHQAGRHSEALARFEAAARAEPESVPAQLGIAKSQIELAHIKEAKEVLGRLSKTHQDNPDVIFWTAKAEQALGNHDVALATYRSAIKAGKGRPESVVAYLSLAKLQAELGQLALAQQTLSEAGSKLPPSGPLHKALGEIAMSRAEYATAYEHFQSALELDRGDTRARFLGAIALTRLGRFEDALSAFESVSASDKDFPGLAVERGRLFEDSGRTGEALVEYESALQKTPDDPDVQIRVGCARVLAGRAADAQELLEKALKARTRSAEASYCLGRALFEQDHPVDAMTRLERALTLDPTRAIYHLYAGWVAMELGHQGEAQRALDKAIELDKGLADAYWLRGRMRLKQGAAKDAILDLEHARELSPARSEVLADLAVAYADTGRTPKALDFWERAIAAEPDNATWHFRYGKLLSSAGNGAMAKAHLQRAVDLVAEDQKPAPGAKPKAPLWLWQAHYLLGRELGLVPAAIAHWQAYLRLSPRDDPYRGEAERALRDLGQPWVQR